MPPSSDDLAVLDRLAEDFVGKLRHGLHPPIQPYADQYPRLATEINRLFPTLVTIEQIGSSVSLPIESGTSDLPAQIGEYRILRKLGEGGMGVVYEAIQESLGRHVALKVLPTHARLSKRFRERFRREARAAARLHHSHIVPVFGVGEEADALFYAMQYIPGRGLDAAIPSRRASPSDDQETVTFAGISSRKTLTSSPEATRWDPVPDSDAAHCRWVAEIGAQVAEALAYAHEEGVIHRDVKPSNLLLDDHGSIWVTDFGLAKTSESDGLTEPGDIVGTIRYMAPERFSGWSDARSDVYGLGATLFELLTRRPMFDDPDRGRLIHAILNSEPPRPRKLNRAIPRDLETIVLKATAREPGHRYSSAQALADDLKRFVAGMPIHARRHTWAGHAWRLCRRRPFAAITTTSLAASILAMLIGSIVVNIWLDDRQTRIANAQSALREQLRETDQAREREIAAKRETRQQLMRALQREAETAIWSRRPGVRESVFEALQQVMNLAGEFPLSPEQRLELRNLAVASFALMDARTEHRDGPPAPPQSYYTPDRTHFAFSPTAGGVIVTEDATGREVARLQTSGPSTFFRFSPDGRFLIVRAGNSPGRKGMHRIVAWDWRENRTLLEQFGTFEGYPCAFRPDSRELAIAHPDGMVTFFSIPDFSEVRQMRWPYPLNSLVYHPTKDRLAGFGWGSHRIEVRDINSGQVQRAFDVANGVRAMGCAWSADGRMLAATSSNYRGYVWNAENGQRVADLVGHQSEVFRCDFGPDAAWLATASWDGTTRFWDPVTGTHLLTAQGNVTSVGSDGRWLSVTRSDRTSILSLEGFAESKTLHAHWGSKGPWHVSFDRQARVLTSSSPDGVRIWNASSGRPLGELSVPGGALTALFHPAGRELITSGYHDCSRWPIEFDDNTHTMRVGPRESLLSESLVSVKSERRAALSADGSRLAVTDQMRGRIDVLSVADPSSRREVGPMANLAGTLMSPDGRWLVGTTWPSPEARIWDVASGRKVRNLSAEKPLTGLAFSPDGKFLCIGSEREPNMMEVGTWQRVRTIPADETGVAAWLPTFSPDGRVLAVARRGNREIQLLDTETLQELARLVPADPQPFTFLTFSPDSRRLAASCATHVVQLWDIGLIRKGLRELNLDWSHPALAMSDDDTEWQLEVHGNSTGKK